MKSNLSLEKLWQAADFNPNPNQKKAITHIDGPLYLPAGPGSGKTRVLLWRTLNLIVFHNINPDEIYLATFTEKAALQLQEGLRTLLGLATNETGIHYDLSSMYIGTVHSLCQRLITDRRFSIDHRRTRVPVLLDDIDQYFFISRRRNWERLLASVGWPADEETHQTINAFFNTNSESKYRAIQHCISLFNRFSEECIEPRQIWRRTKDRDLKRLIDMYGEYLKLLETAQTVPHTDFALVQQCAYSRLNSFVGSGQVFKYVIIDEYQDTNTIQERLYFKLAAGHKNLCVVGDDDQALYRFRGATVENFVEFPERCQQHLGVFANSHPFETNYRLARRLWPSTRASSPAAIGKRMENPTA
ncbi:MAG: UvrD-helicase domain-containing protein [Anaerolineales bacterium]|nr:UvrD-helicase domain-containing protein [Anaerolineales bacterium]